jgi:uncharacterized protein (UPF0335 family)
MAERLNAGSNRPTKAQFRATVREIIELQQERDSANAAVLHRFKAAKKAGFNVKALANAIAARQKDPDVVASEVYDMVEYMHWSGIRISGLQFDLFDADERATMDGLSEKERAEDALWSAGQQGYHAGRAGDHRTASNPHAPGSELYVAWDAGYMRGQEHIAREMGPDALKKPREVVSTRRGARGGRRAKSGNPEDAQPRGTKDEDEGDGEDGATTPAGQQVY